MIAGGPEKVDSEAALAEFRERLDGEFALSLQEQAGGRLLIQLPVGVGKTQWIIKIIEHATTVDQTFDTIIVLFPRWDIIDEVVDRLPSHLDYVLLRPRPRQLCGGLDREWKEFEQSHCGSLGRKLLCCGCPQREDCFWPDQYGPSLGNAKLIIGTQQHSVNNPDFIAMLSRYNGVQRPLVLIDESDILLKDSAHQLPRDHITRFICVLDRVASSSERRSGKIKTWLEVCRQLTEATTDDLRHGDWQLPELDQSLANSIQKSGREIHGADFRFLGYELRHFGKSDPSSRERLENGDIRFAKTPYLGRNFIIFSGSIAKELVRYRIDPNHHRPDISSPFANISFRHPETRWYNIRSAAASAKYFPSNAASILDFFAVKIARNFQTGKRTLLIARKKFLKQCAQYLSERLIELGVDAKIVTGNWDKVDLQDRTILPLINYGVSGLNRFESFEAAYCLTGYYISSKTLEKSVCDLDATTDSFPVSILTQKNPLLRKAHVELPDKRATILPQIAQQVLAQKELDVVIQAIGRVRLFTRPREIITFQADEFKGQDICLEFSSITSARDHFNIQTRRHMDHEKRRATALGYRDSGMPISEIVKRTGFSRSTIKRYLSKGKTGGPPTLLY